MVQPNKEKSNLGHVVIDDVVFGKLSFINIINIINPVIFFLNLNFTLVMNPVSWVYLQIIHIHKHPDPASMRVSNPQIVAQQSIAPPRQKK